MAKGQLSGACACPVRSSCWRTSGGGVGVGAQVASPLMAKEL